MENTLKLVAVEYAVEVLLLWVIPVTLSIVHRIFYPNEDMSLYVKILHNRMSTLVFGTDD